MVYKNIRIFISYENRNAKSSLIWGFQTLMRSPRSGKNSWDKCDTLGQHLFFDSSMCIGSSGQAETVPFVLQPEGCRFSACCCVWGGWRGRSAAHTDPVLTTYSGKGSKEPTCTAISLVTIYIYIYIYAHTQYLSVSLSFII